MTISRLEKSSFFEIPLNEIQSRISDFESDIQRIGSLAILENKNTCYTVLNSEKTDTKIQIKIYSMLLNGFKMQINFVRDSLEASEFDLEQKDQHRKAIKIYCSLLSIITKERFIGVENEVIVKKGRKNMKKICSNYKSNENNEKDRNIWINLTEKFLDELQNLFKFNFHELWSPPIVEEDFLRIIVSFLFKILENNIFSKLKHILYSISNILGLILSKHSALLVVTLKLLNIIQHFDNQVNNMCYVIQIIVNDYNYPHIILHLFKEISQVNIENSGDSASSKNIALFIAQLGNIVPKEVLLNSSLLMCHLEWDPYSMRNAVLETLGAVVVKMLSKEGMDDNLKRTRDSFLDKIQEHLHDVNAFVRSRVLSIFADLVKNRALPLSRFNSLTDLTIRRLNDKSCYVRKNATGLLYQLIVCNPYSQFLNIKDLEAKIEANQPVENNLIQTANAVISDADSAWEKVEAGITLLYKDIEKNAPSDEVLLDELTIDPDDLGPETKQKIINQLLENQYEEAVESLSDHLRISNILDEYSCGTILKLFKILFFEHISLKIIKGEIKQEEVCDDSIQMNRATGNYLKNSLHFAKSVKSSMTVVFKLLQSETISDILEVVQFTITAYKFGICGIYEILDNILPLIWSNEASLKTAMVEASMDILLFSPQCQDKDIIITNLFTNLENSSLGFTKAIEELLCYASEKNLVPPNLVRNLWLIYSNEEYCDMKKSQAVKVLGMLVRGSPGIFDQNLEVLSGVGFAKEASINLAINTAAAIINYSNAKRKAESLIRLEITHVLFKKLKSYLIGKFPSLKTSLWSVLCEHTVRIFISLSNSPLLLINDLLKELFSLITFTPSETDDKVSICYILLGRILHAVSHSAVGILLLLEGDFLTEIKRRSLVVQKSTNKVRQKSRGKSLSTTVIEDITDDPFAIGATADDTEADFVKELCENEILHSENIFSQFIPIISHIIDKNSSYPSDLVCAAALALSKFMLISSDFCSKNLQIMFTLLKKSEIETVRANTVILIGDIIQRFPNLVEPWMSSVFACLRDKSSSFRRVVLSVLSSLILNDMVKIKGQISELALCIEDQDPTISTRTRLFFTELSRKDNAIYNILPDVISRLSDSRESLDRALFEKVMKFLLKFLQKDKHCESLVDKLCNRFALSHNLNEQLDIVYCFLQLNLNERSFKKLIDHFPSFKDKVYDDQLYESFINVIAKFKKSAREEAKIIADEFEQKMTQAHLRGINDENVNLSIKHEEEKAQERPPSPTLSAINKSPKRSMKPREISPKRESPVMRKRTRRGKQLVSRIKEETESDTPPKRKT